MRIHIPLVLVAVGSMLSTWRQAPAETPAASPWTSFRNGGSSCASGDYPITWSPEDGIRWQRELEGYGQSTPVVHGKKVFVASVIGPMKETCCVSCLDLTNGTSIWNHQLPSATPSASNYMHSRAAATPAVDANGVFVFFEGGDLVALDHDGEKLWHRNLAADLGPFENNHGLGSSPAQTDTAVILSLEHQGPSCLVAVDKSTGETLWKAERPSGNSWTSPIVVESPAGPRVIVSSAGSVTAYHAESGQVLWSMDGLEGNSVPSPAAYGDHLLVGARLPEFGESSTAARSNLCLQLADDAYTVAWQAEKVLCDYASPVVAEGCVYFLNKAGVLTCLDLETGERHYTKRLGCTCWATPVVAQNHVYFFGKNGETHVVRAGPTFERVAVNQLWDPDNPPKPQTYVEAEGHGHGHAGGRDHGSKPAGQKPSATGEAPDSSAPQDRFLSMLLAGDENGDGVLTQDELPARFQKMAAGGDRDGDGRLDQAELQAMAKSFAERRAGAREGARDPIVYGVAASDGVLLVRTGTRLYAIAGDRDEQADLTARDVKP